jgi:two-component system, chemotaxis family, sensor kinase CheA
MGEISNPGLQQDGFDLTQFYTVFFEEARENLANMESMLLDIDIAQPTDEELNAIFRVAHSIKGGAATFGFADVSALTHELETLLDRLRRHELSLKRAMVDLLLEAGDVVKAQLARHQGSTDQSPPSDALIRRIRAMASSESGAASVADGTRCLDIRIGPLTSGAVADGLVELFRDIPMLGTIEALDQGQLSADGMRRFKVTTPSPDSELLELFSFHVSREQVRIAAFGAADGQPQQHASGATQEERVPAEGEGYGFFVDPKTLPVQPARKGPTEQSALGEGEVERRSDGRDRREKPATAGLESTTLRVAVEKVDQLINLVGELVITQAMLTQQAKDLDAVQFSSLLGGISDLERSSRHLQETVMSIRMIPMSFVFNRFPRMIRDLASKLGKQIELRMVGEATELDKGLIEKIIDPLTHLVRNSADHGIETPDSRLAAGKLPHGTITLSAAHQGGSILIEVRDDGQGLRRERILNKARERGLSVRDDMTDQEVWALIWEPGFSTADTISDVSGRGVGMDVVRRNIAALNGSVELDAAEGYGTRVTVRLPLTLAIMDGMSIGVSGETYILPLASVVESFQVTQGMVQTVGSTGRVVKVREEFMPVISLDEVFRVPREDGETAPEIMMIVEAEGRRAAVLVDELLGQHQVVVKNLETNYRRVQDISGATILGDGRVALIVDTASLVKRARH